MKNKNKFNLQLHAAETNLTVGTDLEPAISIDYTSRLNKNINELQRLLGVTEMIPMSAGTNIKIYKMEQVNTPDQGGEGETIPLTEINRKLARTVELKLNKYRKSTSAEAIQRSGRSLAVNQTDEKLISGVQTSIKKSFYTLIKTGTGTAKGTNLQSALSAAWGALQKFYVDMTVTPIYFVSSEDLADYLGNAQITLQTAFGMSYIENFLGLGTVIVSPELEKGKVIASAKENINGAYVPANSGDVAQTFNLTSDATGLIGMTHNIDGKTATFETLLFSGVIFFPEFLDGVIVSSIQASEVSVGA